MDKEKFEKKINKRNRLYLKIMWLALMPLVSVPLMWFISVKYAHAKFTLKQIIVNMLLAYSTIGLQLYGIRILFKLIKNYSKQEWLSDDNLKLYQKLGAVMFIYIFVQYIVQSISTIVNADKLQSHEPISFFQVDNMTILAIGAFMFIASRRRLRLTGRSQEA